MVGFFCIFFFVKQKTAYEIMPSLVGSEMCIRDSGAWPDRGIQAAVPRPQECADRRRGAACLLYTSDAADEQLGVDLGGRRSIKENDCPFGTLGDVVESLAGHGSDGRWRAEHEQNLLLT